MLLELVVKRFPLSVFLHVIKNTDRGNLLIVDYFSDRGGGEPRGILEFQIDADGVVVGRVAEFLDPGVTGGFREACADGLGGADLSEQRLGHIDEIDSFSGQGACLKFP